MSRIERPAQTVKYVESQPLEIVQGPSKLAIFGLSPQFPLALRSLNDALVSARFTQGEILGLTIRLTPDNTFPALVTETRYRSDGMSVEFDFWKQDERSFGRVTVGDRSTSIAYSTIDRIKEAIDALDIGQPVHLQAFADSLSKDMIVIREEVKSISNEDALALPAADRDYDLTVQGWRLPFMRLRKIYHDENLLKPIFRVQQISFEGEAQEVEKAIEHLTSLIDYQPVRDELVNPHPFNKERKARAERHVAALKRAQDEAVAQLAPDLADLVDADNIDDLLEQRGITYGDLMKKRSEILNRNAETDPDTAEYLGRNR